MNESSHRESLFPLRLFLLYALLIGLLPTINIWIDFDSLEETEEDWDSTIVLSVIAAVPLVIASWAAIRNARRVPVLAVILALFTAFHLITTGLSCAGGFMGEPYSDSGLSAYAFAGYAKALGLCASPFLAAYLIWFFWPCGRWSSPTTSAA